MDVLHARIQHGVGQGSFHSASLEVGSDSERVRFDYVYDCGAMSGPSLSRELKRTIARMGLEHRAGSSGRGVLDAMVLSHYDSDHLNGAEHLTSLFDVRRIFLPYLSPDELAFVIASQAEALSAEQIGELHQLANGGGTLWSIPVVMVRGGEGTQDEGVVEDRSPRPETSPQDDREPRVKAGVPKSMLLTLRSAVGGAGFGTVPATMSHKDDVLVRLPDGQKLWKLRFWNRGLDPDLVDEIKSQLKNCGFPLDKLVDPAGADHVISWIAIPKNRKAAVKAYGNAIVTLNPTWAHEAKSGGLANLLSLALYSGPDFKVTGMYYRRRHNSMSPLWGMWDYEGVGEGGWLGTGDAPLGEIGVWADFQNHFANDLPAVSTYLVPHHGAAPSGGPSYYHAGLNHTPGVASVISYGSTNNYGHPRSSVLTKILANRGQLYEVTESCERGFHEVLRLSSA